MKLNRKFPEGKWKKSLLLILGNRNNKEKLCLLFTHLCLRLTGMLVLYERERGKKNVPFVTISQVPRLNLLFLSINMLPIHMNMPCSYPLICLCLCINYDRREDTSLLFQILLSPLPLGLFSLIRRHPSGLLWTQSSKPHPSVAPAASHCPSLRSAIVS